jgi:excinuclease UvrABC helicase subunit UvrB
LIELRQTLTQLNDAVTQIARSGNLEQANQVRDLLVQVKREIYKLLAEQ